MGTFYVGDRVRLGRVRGGVVVEHDGRLRVRFQDSRQLLWMEHMVPDEGPDGPIYPQTWNTCEGCGHPTVTEFVCVNCEARAHRAFVAFDRSERRAEDESRASRGLPTWGVHIAGPVIKDGRVVRQHCARCNAVLHGYLVGPGHEDDPVTGMSREGEYLFMGGLGLSGLMPGQRPEATCTPVAGYRAESRRLSA